MERILKVLTRIPAGPLVAAVAVGGIWLMSGTPTASARIPALAGMQVNPAIAKAAKAGFFTKVEFRRGGGIAGTVVGQDPQPEVIRDKHSMIVLEVTRGAAQVKVPDVRHLPVDEARRRIDRGNLTPGTVTFRSDSDLQPDRVISTVPKAGTLVDVHTRVDIIAAT